ncbi:hypothetical protein SFRURICE_020251 [Spodoptera frugiperda]|nr:hypothetical protein SFRURICE_020251 [Spodoptera frugiperda]
MVNKIVDGDHREPLMTVAGNIATSDGRIDLFRSLNISIIFVQQLSSQELMVRHQLGQEETPPHPVYPHSGYNVLPSGDDIIPIRDGGEDDSVYDHEESARAREVMKMKFRNIFKHWMDNYRRSQQNPDDGYYVESL